ncbi:heme oxygenase (biliverdin-IX-beta and delta-forming) [Marchantia polymorpha subsp. ruderalis]
MATSWISATGSARAATGVCSGPTFCGSVPLVRKKWARQLEMRKEWGEVSRLVDFCELSKSSTSQRSCFQVVRAGGDNGTSWSTDDQSPLSFDNGFALFGPSSAHIVGSPSQQLYAEELEDETLVSSEDEHETPDSAREFENNQRGDGAGSPASSVVAGAAGSNRAGLYRSPISGGVQSATSSHGLPSPAIAVRNLIEQARYAHLCTIMSRMHHRRRGYPFGSLVEFATDSSGHPIFSLSPLAIHTRNLLADPRCTLVVQVPGWSGLANARVTLFGDVYPLPAEQQEWAHKHYSVKHQHGASQQWGNFNYYRMETISDVYFVGGFGTVAWVDVKDFESALPDVIAANGSEKTLQELNLKFSKPLREVLSVEAEVDDAALISIDSKGVDIRVRHGAQFNVQRLPFDEDHAVETLDQAIWALQKVLDDVAKVSQKL